MILEAPAIDAAMKWPVVRRPGEPLGALVSYAFAGMNDVRTGFKMLEAARPLADVVIFDSGAFSVRRRGHEVAIDRYAAFAGQAARRGLVDVVVNLDVGDTANMMSNFARIQRAVGDHAYPLWVHQPFMGEDALRRWASRYPYIGLGTAGMDTGSHAVMRGESERAYYRRCHAVLAECGAVAHGFAMTSVPLLYDPGAPWLTVDSSTWVSSDRFGFSVMPDFEDEPTAWHIPAPYTTKPRVTNLGNRIPTVPFDRASHVLSKYGLPIARWSTLSKTEVCVACGIGHVAIADDLATRRPPRDPRALQRLSDVGLPQFAESRGTCVFLVLLATGLSVPRLHGVKVVRDRTPTVPYAE